MKNLHEVQLQVPLEPRMDKEAGIVNWHVSKGVMETYASGVDGPGRGL